jgi:hypothetical protein
MGKSNENPENRFQTQQAFYMSVMGLKKEKDILLSPAEGYSG